jgi:IS30 family transposase
MTRKNRQLIEGKLRKEQWSPEQISDWSGDSQVVSISHERIYQHVWEDKYQGGGLWKHLRQASKKYRKRTWRSRSKGTNPQPDQY